MTNVTEHETPITISTRDYDQLDRIATAGMRRNSSVPHVLADELARAEIVSPHEMRPNVVTMNSSLTFRDDVTHEIRRVTLVYPGEEDIALGRISILTPVGTALIGVSEGDAIGWRTTAGELRRLTILKVHSQHVAEAHAR